MTDPTPLRCTSYDYNDWSDVYQISSSYATTVTPALAVFPVTGENQRLYCVYMGGKPDLLWTSSLTGFSDWDMQRRAPQSNAGAGPAVSTHTFAPEEPAKIYSVWPVSSGCAWCSTADGKTWSSAEFFSSPIDARPALASFDFRLIVAGEADGKLSAQEYDGEEWTDVPGLEAHDAVGPPAMTVYDEDLHLIRPRGQNRLSVTVYDGDGWSEDDDILLPNQPEYPALEMFNDTFVCVYTDSQTGNLWFTQRNPDEDWSSPKAIRKGQADQPAGWAGLKFFNGRMFCLYEPK